MIKTEFYRMREDGTELYRTYSDKGLQIRKVGTSEVYDEAIDIENAPYAYEETDIPTEDANEEDYQEALREMGVKV